MHLRKMLVSITKFFLCLSLLFPVASFAHLIAINATPGLPAQVASDTTTTGIYTVTNISSRLTITVQDRSRFPAGLSILASTCGVPIRPGQACQITLQLEAPCTTQTINAELRERAAPSADGVQFPIVVQVIRTPRPPTQIIVTSFAGPGGSVAPFGPQIVNSGANLIFTATPLPGLSVGQWFVDGVVAQQGGSIFALTNIMTTHSVFVTFAPGTSITAAGGQEGISFGPLLVVSTNGGVNFRNEAIFSAPALGFFNASSCTGIGVNAVCAVAGKNEITTGALVATSTSGGTSWVVRPVIGDPLNTEFFSVSCTGSGSTAICAAAGSQVVMGVVSPLLAVSTDGGVTWTTRTVTGIAPQSEFSSVNCTGSGATAICAAVGEVVPGTPLVAVSNDGGATWAVRPIAGAPADGPLASVSCTGTGVTAVCAAGGENISAGGQGLIVVSRDGGNTWTFVPTIPTTPGSEVLSISCTGPGPSAICMAVGLTDDANGTPLIITSVNGGITWLLKTPTGLPSGGVLQGASCTGSGPTAVCVGAGGLTPTLSPLIVASNDGGNTFVFRPVVGSPAAGVFNGVSCTGTGSTAFCVAAGIDGTGLQPPLIAASFDGGLNWQVRTILNAPASGVLIGVGTTGGTLTQKKFGFKNELRKHLSIKK